MITIKDVAKAAGVSVSTVSYVLNNDSRITAETRKRVMDAIRETGYCGNAGRKKEDKTKKKENPNIVLCLHSVFGPVYSAIISSMKRIFDLNGFNLYIHIDDKLVYNDWADGYIILNSKIDDKEIFSLSQKQIPCILLDRKTMFPNIQHVLIDNEKGEYDLVKRLICLGKTSFAFVSGIANSYDATMRYEGYCNALKDHSINPDDMIFIRGDYSYESGAEAAKFLISRTSLPQAIICANDEMALGVLHTLSRYPQNARPLDTPEDKPVIAGFDGFHINSTETVFPSVIVDFESLGSIAAYSMTERLQKNIINSEDILIKTEVFGL